MYKVYILLCRDNSFYIGFTQDLKQRLENHKNRRGSFYVSKRLPIKLVHYEKYNTITEAMNREKQLKGWSRKKKIDLIKTATKKK